MKTQSCRCCDGSGRELDQTSVAIEMIKTRKKFGLSQGELSRRLGFSAAYLSDLEGGKRKWRQELIDKYLKACER